MKPQTKPIRRGIDPPTTRHVALGLPEPSQPHPYLTRIDVYQERVHRLDINATGVHIGPEYAKPISRDPKGAIEEQYHFRSNPDFIVKRLMTALDGLKIIATDQTDERVFIYYFGEKRLEEVKERIEKLKREYK